MATGQPLLPRADRLCYEKLVWDLRQHYQATGQRNIKEAATRLNPLDIFFRGYRVVNITSTETTKYVTWRQGQSVSNSTIKREISVLIEMFKLGCEG